MLTKSRAKIATSISFLWIALVAPATGNCAPSLVSVSRAIDFDDPSMLPRTYEGLLPGEGSKWEQGLSREEAKQLISLVDKEGLLFTCVERGASNIFQYFVLLGADFNIVSEDGNPLPILVVLDEPGLIDFILEEEIDFLHQNARGKNIAAVLIERGYFSRAISLIEKKENILASDFRGNTPLHSMCYALYTVKLGLQFQSEMLAYEDRLRPLDISSIINQAQEVQKQLCENSRYTKQLATEIVGQGFDLDTPNNDGVSARELIQSNSLEELYFLLDEE